MAQQSKFSSVADRDLIEAEMTWEERDLPATLDGLLTRVKAAHGSRPAISYQILSDPGSKSITLSWAELTDEVRRAANLFRSLGVGETDTVAFLLPNCLEAAVTFLGGAVAGVVNPINPLLEPAQIGAILKESGAKVLVTLKSFPKSDVAQKAAAAQRMAPGVKHVVEVDLRRYLAPPKSWLIPLVRPKMPQSYSVPVQDFGAAVARQPATLSFPDAAQDRIAAMFHTGGTTGMPKVARHRYSGMIYNGWIGQRLLFTETDVVMCPLPLFHVFACYPVLLSMISAGAHAVFPTPAGYRGEGVFDNFWKLCAHWQATFMIGVPTAFSALMQRPVDADLSRLKLAFSGSAPLPVELYNRFEKAAGVNICEGYGLTEATCLVACNPPREGEKKIGSVGIPFPHSDVRILKSTPDGPVACDVDEVGEICVDNPGVYEGSTYTEEDKNRDLFHHERYLRTGDLGRIDADGYLWITGRAKDLIIRGGHNIDPAVIEEALLAHKAVAFAGAIGQPDAHAGEIPCVYVELIEGAKVTTDALVAHLEQHVHERAARPKHIEVLDALPKTAVGKVFKPDLRRRAITRVLNEALTDAGSAARVAEVIEDKKRGLVARVSIPTGEDSATLSKTLGTFSTPWEPAP